MYIQPLPKKKDSFLNVIFTVIPAEIVSIINSQQSDGTGHFT